MRVFQKYFSALCTLNRRGSVANNETHHNRQQQTKALNNYYDTSLNVLKLLLDNVNTFPSSAFDMTWKTRDADESFRILTAWAVGRQNEQRCFFCLRITYTAERDNSHRLETFSCGKNPFYVFALKSGKGLEVASVGFED